MLDLVERPGLEGVVAARTRLSHVDGLAGELVIGGYRVEDLALHASFEEALFLLWNDCLPSPAELGALRRALGEHGVLPPVAIDLMHSAADRGTAPMAALRMGAATLDLEPVSSGEEAFRAVGALPSLLGAYARRRAGLPSLERDPAHGHAESILHLLGLPADRPRVAALDAYLVTVCDHGLNASTFAARVVASTGASLTDALVAALGALSGPLHGGAPGPALETVFEIARPERAEAVLRDKLVRGERLMGFGHRIYKVRDPRADVLDQAARTLFTVGGGDPALYALARHVEETALRLLEAHKSGRAIRTNVEFYTALLLHGLGLSPDLFTPVFAMGRVAGWTAHVLEQRRNGRLLRPQSIHEGPRDRRWASADDAALSDEGAIS